MATRAERRAHLQGQKPATDSFQNLNARLGIGADNIFGDGQYALNPVSRRRVDLDYAYRGSWIVGAAVDSVADDMTRAGIDYVSSIDPDDAETLQAAFERMEIWQELSNGLRWGRLYGGCIVVMLIDGQDFSQPLRPETVGGGQFKGLMTLDRWQLIPSFDSVVTEFGPDFGRPVFYRCVADQGAMTGLGSTSPLLGQSIHYSRVFRFEGLTLPFYQRQAEQGWGMSILERLWDRLVAFDSVTTGAAQLAFKAHLRTMKVEGLDKILSMGGPAYEAFIKRVEGIRKFQSTEGLTVVDAKDEIEYTSYSFAGLSDMMMQFGEQISGALQIPLVRLFGQSPGGLNSSGESDLRTYYDGISKEQERTLRGPLGRLFDVLWRSELGREIDEGFQYVFSPLWQMSHKEKADIAAVITQTVSTAFNDGAADRATYLKELRNSSQTTGIWSNISDEEITEAEEEPPLPRAEHFMTEESNPFAPKPDKDAEDDKPDKTEDAEP